MGSKQGKNAFDDLGHYYTRTVTYNGTTLVNTEIDLNVPRGYVANVRKVRTTDRNVGVAAFAAGASFRTFGCLVNDPDDSATATPPNGQEHDVIHVFDRNLYSNATDDVGISQQSTETDFEGMGLDMPIVRKMNYNIDSDNAACDHSSLLEIWYKLVKVTDTQKLELLEIL